jgi:hypothetical protein
MTAEEALAAIRVKIDRANHHIRDLEGQVGAFLDAKPYKVGAKRDPQTRKTIYYVVSVSETPFGIASTAGDAIQNLRSALDHLAYRLVVVGLGAPPLRPEYIAYPIADSQAQYPSLRDGKVKGARQDAKDAIDATKPYPGGNDALWRLHKLNNIDKHRLLLTVGSGFRSVDIGAEMHRIFAKAFPLDPTVSLPHLPLFVRPGDRLFPLKAGDELYIGGVDDEVNEKMQFRFDVAVGEPRIFDGEPILKTLQDMAKLVDHIVLSFKPLLV